MYVDNIKQLCKLDWNILYVEVVIKALCFILHFILQLLV